MNNVGAALRFHVRNAGTSAGVAFDDVMKRI
jgi:hypothetical protein